MTVKELFDVGQLDEAVAAAAEEVKRHPADAGQRALLCELLCFAGDLERADKHLDAMGVQEAEAAMAISLFRQLLRAEQARRDFYAAGRLPEFLDPPSPELKRRLEASICLREDRADEAARLLDEAEALRPVKRGTCNGEAFDDLRDLDDLTASFFEVLTTTGKYYWVPVERVETVEFRPPERLRDLLWRRAHLVVRGGPDGEVFLPTLYAGSHDDPDDRIRLGRYTDWRGGDGAPVRGSGQRMFLAGDRERSILELEEIAITDPAPGAHDEPNPS